MAAFIGTTTDQQHVHIVHVNCIDHRTHRDHQTDSHGKTVEVILYHHDDNLM